MDYNTQRKRLLLPEYGRHIQNMVDEIATIEDREERNRAAKTVINVMGNLYPHLRDILDFRHKLWDHLAIMSGFNLDIDTPYPVPSRESLAGKPEKIEYGEKTIKLKHYGAMAEKMLQKIDTLESEEQKKDLLILAANHMKKSFQEWNSDSVEDDRIFDDIRAMNENIEIPDGLVLTRYREPVAPKKTGKNQNGFPNHLPNTNRQPGRTNAGKKPYYKKPYA
ncbi:MAG: DUF4290 domain-containing protein [Odoribacteraceae bacterium]|jgi:hypothetical protein|nr:DUF4290 domain-containing protein [Odoribacteraceae bacterium]